MQKQNSQLVLSLPQDVTTALLETLRESQTPLALQMRQELGQVLSSHGSSLPQQSAPTVLPNQVEDLNASVPRAYDKSKRNATQPAAARARASDGAVSAGASYVSGAGGGGGVHEEQRREFLSRWSIMPQEDKEAALAELSRALPEPLQSLLHTPTKSVHSDYVDARLASEASRQHVSELSSVTDEHRKAFMGRWANLPPEGKEAALAQLSLSRDIRELGQQSPKVKENNSVMDKQSVVDKGTKLGGGRGGGGGGLRNEDKFHGTKFREAARARFSGSTITRDQKRPRKLVRGSPLLPPPPPTFAQLDLDVEDVFAEEESQHSTLARSARENAPVIAVIFLLMILSMIGAAVEVFTLWLSAIQARPP